MFLPNEVAMEIPRLSDWQTALLAIAIIVCLAVVVIVGRWLLRPFFNKGFASALYGSNEEANAVILRREVVEAAFELKSAQTSVEETDQRLVSFKTRYIEILPRLRISGEAQENALTLLETVWRNILAGQYESPYDAQLDQFMSTGFITDD